MATETPVVLPFRGNQFSFSLTCKENPQETPVADLASVLFGRDGQVLDVVHPNKLSALMGAVCSGRDSSLWPENCQPVPGDDVIHVFPKKMDPAAEAIALVVSAPQCPGKVIDLGSAPKLDFVVTFSEPGDPGTQSRINRDLKAYTPKLLEEGKGGSMVACVAYLDQPGWTVRFDLAGSPLPSWSMMVPEMKAAILRVKTEAGVALDACQAIEAQPQDETTILGFSRVYEDRSLDEATSIRLPEPTQVSKLRLDVAWKFWNPKKEPEEEMEGVNVEFAIKFFDGNGEEILSAGTGEREADGVVVGRPDPEEGEEEEKEEEEKEEEEDEEGEGEEEDVLDENGEPVLNEDGEPVKKPKKEKPPPPPEPAEDPYEFKLRDVAFITLKELPKEARSFIVLITNYEEAGFKPIKHAGIKLWDISKGEDQARPLMDYSHISKFEMEEKVTQVVLLKVYKEYDDSAWNLWREAARDKGVRTLEEWVHGDPNAIKTALKEAQAKHKAYKAQVAQREQAEEEDEENPPPELRTYKWRYSVPALVMGGGSLEEAEHDIKDNLLNYDGPLRANEARNYDCARVQFSGEVQDTYFGSYAGDLKCGPGIYCFATSAFYAGDFKGGKREGRGIHLMPDGGLYEGELANDRFHGQGQYRYPDGSVYTGSWAGGKKDGPGMYWDLAKGCMRGNWSKGVLKGHAVYDQPAMHYEGEYVRGVPAGPCQFTIALNRTLDMPKFAASHILDSKPVLKAPAEYSIPPGSGVEPELDEEGQPIEDGDKPPLPTLATGYEGLGFKSSGLPEAVDEIVFPPPEATPVPIPGVPQFKIPPPGVKIPGGIIPPAAPAPPPAAEAPPAQA